MMKKFCFGIWCVNLKVVYLKVLIIIINMMLINVVSGIILIKEVVNRIKYSSNMVVIIFDRWLCLLELMLIIDCLIMV